MHRRLELAAAILVAAIVALTGTAAGVTPGDSAAHATLHDSAAAPTPGHPETGATSQEAPAEADKEDEDARDPAALEIMRRTDAALADVDALEFDFAMTGTHARAGRTTGHAVVERTDSLVRMRYRASIDVHVTPQTLQRVGSRVEVASDGDRVWMLDHDDEVLHVGSAAGGAGALQMPVTQFLMPLMVRSLQSVEIDLPERMSLAGRADVGGVESDVIYLDFPDDSGYGEQYFYVGREDHLPRRIVLVTSGGNGTPSQFDFTMTNLRVVEPDDVDFRIGAPDGYRVADDALRVAPGAVAEDWERTTADGDTVRLSELRGKVVVLDFWASWCPICRNQLPMVSRVAEEMVGQPVEFYGVNTWETGEPLAFLEEIGADIPVFLEADDLAARYRVSGTGIIVIIDPEGRFLPRMYGNTTRETLTQTIRSALPESVTDPAS